MRQIIRRGAIGAAAAAAIACSMASTSSVRADDGAGAIRFGADLHVLNVRQYPNDSPFVNDDPTIQFGVYNAVGGTDEFLYFAPQFGYLLTESIVIGAHLGFGVVSFNGSDAGVGVHLVPFFEYILSPGETIRPFVGAEVGPRIFSIPGPTDAYVTLVAGGFGGVHIFLEESFSISPFASVDFLYNSLSERAGYEIVLGASFQGWVGGG